MERLQIVTTYFENEQPHTLHLTSGDHYRGLQTQCPDCDHKFLKRINITVDATKTAEHIELEYRRLKEEVASLRAEKWKACYALARQILGTIRILCSNV